MVRSFFRNFISLPSLRQQSNKSAARATCGLPRRLRHEQLELRQMLSAASADFDGSLLIDGGDLSIWEQGFGATSAVHAQGDADLDGDVDGGDFLAWQRGLGSSVAPSLPHDPINWSAEIAARVAAGGTVMTVSTESALTSAISASSPGDVVLIADGLYNHWNITIPEGKNGLLITAENPGEVTLRFGVRFIIRGDDNIIGGLNFDRLSQIHAIEFNTASGNRFTDNRFVNSGRLDSPKSRMILIVDGSNGNRFDHNDFAGNRAFGLVIDAPGLDDTFAFSRDNRVDHNVWRDILSVTNQGDKVPLQIGNGSDTSRETRTLVDHNEFRNLATKGSIINGKSSGETYLNNRFINIPQGYLSLRSGNNKLVEGNYFENTQRGVTAVGANHRIINNVIVNPREAGILIHNWGRAVGGSGAVTYAPTRDILVANNTIIGSLDNAIEIGRNWGFGGGASNPTENVRVINNIFQSSAGKLVDLRTPQINLTLQNNLYYATGTATTGSLGTDSIVGNPNLTPTHELSASSTLAIDSGVALPEVTSDFDGNARTGATDVGAYEFGSVPTAATSSSGGAGEVLAAEVLATEVMVSVVSEAFTQWEETRIVSGLAGVSPQRAERPGPLLDLASQSQVQLNLNGADNDADDGPVIDGAPTSSPVHGLQDVPERIDLVSAVNYELDYSLALDHASLFALDESWLDAEQGGLETQDE